MRNIGDRVAVRELKSEGSETTDTTGSAVDLGAASPNSADPLALLNITAVSGTTPTLDLVIEGSDDGTTWATAGTFTQKTGTGKDAIAVTPFRQYRYDSTIAGTTPDFTYGVDIVVPVAEAPAATRYA